MGFEVEADGVFVTSSGSLAEACALARSACADRRGGKYTVTLRGVLRATYKFANGHVVPWVA